MNKLEADLLECGLIKEREVSVSEDKDILKMLVSFNYNMPQQEIYDMEANLKMLEEEFNTHNGVVLDDMLLTIELEDDNYMEIVMWNINQVPRSTISHYYIENKEYSDLEQFGKIKLYNEFNNDSLKDEFKIDIEYYGTRMLSFDLIKLIPLALMDN